MDFARWQKRVEAERPILDGFYRWAKGSNWAACGFVMMALAAMLLGVRSLAVFAYVLAIASNVVGGIAMHKATRMLAARTAELEREIKL